MNDRNHAHGNESSSWHPQVTGPAAFYALVPAAGCGARMGAEHPKQYLPLAGHTVIHHALQALCKVPRVKRVFVVLAPGDARWRSQDWSVLGAKLSPLFCGGATRAESVRNGLRAMAAQVQPQDWVLVHDAARPCLAPWHVDALIDGVCAHGGDYEDGGILALPVADTLKRADEHDHAAIAATVPRAGLWQAQTPQMFRYRYLRRALEGMNRLDVITDEASAMESLGFRPRLVMADPTNLKVTYPLDLNLAAWILQHRGELP
ncbi:MAG: 2-C-methyl-D-erythritol 4-phosphate cytidylyltransferase [Sterolibacterium sp.]|jgi:2-C-methyl-D-erythritol 4-phosphate cytidylyltransferase|nr:2-C-methyl-D-erythritol 4-phosphate cytidylyltransferase [Sterolibacterium sp.]MBP9799028.1 2-C-methyl-D-erythritol 4-phosphate cytidylyltransferase [Sterolibacterium sp.]